MKAKINFPQGFDKNGELAEEQLFTHSFNTLPHKTIFRLNQDSNIDLSKIDLKLLQEAFPDAEIRYIRYQNKETTSCVDDVESGEELFIIDKWESSKIYIFDHECFYIINNSAISILHTAEDVVDNFNKLFKHLIKIKSTPKEQEVKLVCYDGGAYYTIKSKINHTKLDLHSNYNDDFMPVYDDIVKFLDKSERKSGLIVMNGVPGTGKSTFIRHLVSNHPNNYIIITPAIAAHLAAPEFTSFLLNNKDAVFIMEDCEQVIMDRGTNTFGSAVAALLNMSDGLMSDIFNGKFICTFNADIKDIDKAVLRKGRCFANYEFKALSADKADKLLIQRGLEPTNKELTLAEIYNYEEINVPDIEIKPKKIGF